MATHAWDLLDRRILACVAFVDARGRIVTAPLAVVAPEGVGFFWKRPGMLIVTDAPGLSAHSAAFDAPPVAPAAGSVRLVIDIRPSDPGLAPRSFELRLPRNAAPDGDESLFTPAEVVLPPAPSAAIDGFAAGIRVSVTRSDDGRAVEGALVRLRPSGGLPPSIALTDAAGDALVIADAIPLTTPGPGAVMQGDFEAQLDALVVPARVRFHTTDEIFAARRAAMARTAGFINPDALTGARTPVQQVRIAAGRIATAAIAWTPP